MPTSSPFFDDEALRGVVDDDLDALLLGVVELPGRRLEERARAARHDLDVRAAEAARGAAAVHRGVADADDEDALADLARCGRRRPTRASRCRCGCGSDFVVASGEVELLAARGAAADEDGVEALVEECTHARDGRVVAHVDAHARGSCSSLRRAPRSGRRNAGMFERISPPGLSYCSKMVTS